MPIGTAPLLFLGKMRCEEIWKKILKEFDGFNENNYFCALHQ